MDASKIIDGLHTAFVICDESKKTEVVRDKFVIFGYRLNELLPDGREKALVMTKLEEAAMWAGMAIQKEGK